MTRPKRIQLSRAKGWRMPANAKKVDRSTRFGNPFAVEPGRSAEQAVELFRKLLAGDTQVAGAAIWRATIMEHMGELRGKDLACWCALDAPCHADVLLQWANREEG